MHQRSCRSALQAFLALVIVCLAASPARAGDPTGLWLRPSTGTEILMFRCGGSLCGRIASVKDPARRETIGKVIVSGGQQTADNVWEGDLFNTEDGSTYSGHLTLQNASTLRLQGCALASVVCKGETWTRVR